MFFKLIMRASQTIWYTFGACTLYIYMKIKLVQSKEQMDNSVLLPSPARLSFALCLGGKFAIMPIVFWAQQSSRLHHLPKCCQNLNLMPITSYYKRPLKSRVVFWRTRLNECQANLTILFKAEGLLVWKSSALNSSKH